MYKNNYKKKENYIFKNNEHLFIENEENSVIKKYKKTYKIFVFLELFNKIDNIINNTDLEYNEEKTTVLVSKDGEYTYKQSKRENTNKEPQVYLYRTTYETIDTYMLYSYLPPDYNLVHVSDMVEYTELINHIPYEHSVVELTKRIYNIGSTNKAKFIVEFINVDKLYKFYFKIERNKKDNLMENDVKLKEDISSFLSKIK